jgi:hypothetical protein
MTRFDTFRGAKAVIQPSKGDKSTKGPYGEGYLQVFIVVSIEREPE